MNNDTKIIHISNVVSPWDDTGTMVPAFTVLYRGKTFDYFGSQSDLGTAFVAQNKRLVRSWCGIKSPYMPTLQKREGQVHLVYFANNKKMRRLDDCSKEVSETKVEGDLNNAIACILGDALSYCNADNEEEFMGDFGYSDGDYAMFKAGQKAFQACKHTFEKLEMREDEISSELERVQDAN